MPCPRLPLQAMRGTIVDINNFYQYNLVSTSVSLGMIANAVPQTTTASVACSVL